MFGGLIEQIGTIYSIVHYKNSKQLYIKVNNDFIKDIDIGDSIAIDGLCLTVEEKKNSILKFTALDKSVKNSIIKFYKKNDTVNIEKALTLNKYIGGHIIQGHIDGIGKIKSIKVYGNRKTYTVLLNSSLGKYIIKNDSIALNGISLTIKELFNNEFTIDIIPETLKRTNIDYLRIGDYVNVEINHITKSVYEFIKRGR